MIPAHLAWMRSRNLARSTINTRAGILDAVAAVCDPAAATPADLEHVIAARRLSAATRNVWISHLSGFYRWAVDEGVCVTNPARRVPRAVTGRNLPRPIPEHALRLALAHADTRMTAWLTLAGWAGLRCCEISGLRGENVSTDMGTLRVDASKRGRSRIIPMHPKVDAALEPFPVTSGRLWTNPPAVVSTLISRHFRDLGLPYSAHQLRHRFATQAYEACGDLAVVAELCGHESIETTRIYAAVSPLRRAAAVALIA
jgi:site-specific recombinase XerD